LISPPRAGDGRLKSKLTVRGGGDNEEGVKVEVKF
jgi:hypothetical protein